MPAEGQQVGLDLWPREHDLPPRWDGLAIDRLNRLMARYAIWVGTPRRKAQPGA